jgi:CobQ/CobB/MinD/ParA nucleotide binding domain
MIQGTSSWPKSLLTTARCRSFARRGLRVAQFKAQSMSNNARVVDGGEIGVAQYLQALAAGIEPDVRSADRRTRSHAASYECRGGETGCSALDQISCAGRCCRVGRCLNA